MLTGLYWPTTVRGRLRHRQSTAPATTPKPTISRRAELAGAAGGVFGVCSVPFVGGFFEARSAAISASSVAATAPTRCHVAGIEPLRAYAVKGGETQFGPHESDALRKPSVTVVASTPLWLEMADGCASGWLRWRRKLMVAERRRAKKSL